MGECHAWDSSPKQADSGTSALQLHAPATPTPSRCLHAPDSPPSVEPQLLGGGWLGRRMKLTSPPPSGSMLPPCQPLSWCPWPHVCGRSHTHMDHEAARRGHWNMGHASPPPHISTLLLHCITCPCPWGIQLFCKRETTATRRGIGTSEAWSDRPATPQSTCSV